MGTPLGTKYIPYTYMDPLGSGGRRAVRRGRETASERERESE